MFLKSNSGLEYPLILNFGPDKILNFGILAKLNFAFYSLCMASITKLDDTNCF